MIKFESVELINLDINSRCYQLLEKLKIKTIGDLPPSVGELLEHDGFGVGTLQSLLEAIEKHIEWELADLRRTIEVVKSVKKGIGIK